MKKKISVFLLALLALTAIMLGTPIRNALANAAFSLGNYTFGGGAYNISTARISFSVSSILNPNLHGAHYQLARIHFIKGDFSRALDEINKELLAYPDFKRSYYVRGLIYGYMGKYIEAAADFNEFLLWKPNSWAGYNDLAWVYFSSGKYEASRAASLAGLKVDSDNPWLLNSLGVSLLNLGDKKGARESFTKSSQALSSMSSDDWGKAYPGNDPKIYDQGFDQMRLSIKENMGLLPAGDM
jgi:tetratricopeptide (TPR) repeat protein